MQVLKKYNCRVLCFFLLIFTIFRISNAVKKTFYAVPKVVYIDAARNICSTNGMELATIESEAEEYFVEKYLRIMGLAEGGDAKFFINLRRESPLSETFIWDTTPPRDLTYAKWGKGEPNGLKGKWRGQEIYVIIHNLNEDDNITWGDTTQYCLANPLCMKIT